MITLADILLDITWTYSPNHSLAEVLMQYSSTHRPLYSTHLYIWYSNDIAIARLGYEEVAKNFTYISLTGPCKVEQPDAQK